MKINIGPYVDTGEREIDIKIDDYDTWSMDSTLAFIIVPMLKQLRETKHGNTMVDNEDLPVHLRHDNWTTDEAQQYDLFADSDYDKLVWDSYEPRWNYVLDEMIWAFEQVNSNWESQFYSGEHDMISVPVDADGNEVPKKDAKWFEYRKGPNDTFEIDWAGRTQYADRIANGFLLFGKYYQGLWD